MIRSFRSRALKRFFEKGETKGLQPQYIEKIRRVLFALNVTQSVQELDIPGFGLHLLKGDRDGYWAIFVSRNWRITFRFNDVSSDIFNEDGNSSIEEVEMTAIDESGAYEVDYEDYH